MQARISTILTTAALAALAARSALADIATTSVSFQEGVDGYSGVIERLISQTSSAELPAAGNLTPPNWFVDGGNTPSSPDQQALIRFDNIIGSAAGRIPMGAKILSASFQLTTAPSDPAAGGNANAMTGGFFSLARLTTPFTTSSTYTQFSAFGPYYSTGLASRPTSGFVDLADGIVDTDSVIDADQVVSVPVTQFVQAWASGQANHGLTVQPGNPPATTDGWMIGTSFNADTARRPKLSVTYTTAPVQTAVFQQGLNGYAGMRMSWLKQNNNSGANQPLDGSQINQAFLDGPATNSPDDQSLIRFDSLFKSAAGPIPADAQIINAYVVMTTSNNSTDARTRGEYNIHQMLVDWDLDSSTGTPSYYSEFSGGAGPSDGTDIGPILDSKAALVTDSEAWFDITSAMKAWQTGSANFGLNIQAGATSDGWQIYFTGAANQDARPRLVANYFLPEVTWAADADGNWSAPANWQGVIPDDIGRSVIFGNAITADRTVTVDAPHTVGAITFDSTHSYTIAGTSTLNLNSNAGHASISVLSGSHAINAPIVLQTDTNVSVVAGSTLTIGGNMTATGKVITKNGAGAAQFENIRAAGLSVAEGTAKIRARAASNDLTGTSVVSALSIGVGATLDLTNNSFVLDYSGSVGTLVNDVRENLSAGRLTSTLADASRRLGYGDNAILNATTFGGVSVDSSALLVKFTFGGDANLDGQVDVTDLGALATNWQTSAPWIGGDFNYDGFVDVSDLGVLATNWQLGVGSPLGRQSLESALAAVGLGGVSVPEPSSVAMLCACGGMLSRRSRRVLARYVP